MSPLATQFIQLSQLLRDTQQYWRPMAFYQSHLAWMSEQPELTERLFSLSSQQVAQLASDDAALSAFCQPYLSFASQLHSASLLAPLPQQALPPVNPRFYSGMPGRKWQQIQIFAASLSASQRPIVEWCAGKSYLGFYLQQQFGCRVDALEWDAALVQAARERAEQNKVALFSHQVDVLSEQADQHLCREQQLVALHACGELHERMLTLAAERQVEQIQLAPCCYHKRREQDYQGLSQLARTQGLTLNKQELHGAVMETATAGATVQRQRKQLQIMRLGFAELLRECCGLEGHLPQPSLANSWSKAEFQHVCQHLAELKHISLPADIDWQHYLQRGEQRFAQVSALDLVRFLFRRPLEVWLALDRALLLEEQGYAVELGSFCPAPVTPRNILLKAVRH